MALARINARLFQHFSDIGPECLPGLPLIVRHRLQPCCVAHRDKVAVFKPMGECRLDFPAFGGFVGRSEFSEGIEVGGEPCAGLLLEIIPFLRA
jgi:hypothetical protein